jgi:hypothetical protein
VHDSNTPTCERQFLQRERTVQTKAAGKNPGMDEHFEDAEQPRKDSGRDPLAGRGSGEEDPGYGSEREAEEQALDDEARDTD